MTKILGIDTSNYTTSAAIVEDGTVVYDERCLLNVKLGEKGLRQSEALFQHIDNLPLLLNTPLLKGINAVCVSEKPRPVEGSYMPVFKAGISIGMSISSALGVPFYKTTHQEGHIEAAVHSIGFKSDSFVAIHMSGGTTEVLKVNSNDKGYDIDILGGTKDISFGQFIDRIGVALGLPFPSGKYMDEYALEIKESNLRIPSHVEGMYFNLSGQETMGLKYVKYGYNVKEIAFASMLCAAKTLEKVIRNLQKEIRLPVLLMGGVASSKFLKAYFKSKCYNYIHFSHERYASDNAVGDAYIGSKIYEKGEIL